MGRHKLKSVNLQGIELDTIQEFFGAFSAEIEAIKIKRGGTVKELTKDELTLQVELHIQRREEQKWE